VSDRRLIQVIRPWDPARLRRSLPSRRTSLTASQVSSTRTMAIRAV